MCRASSFNRGAKNIIACRAAVDDQMQEADPHYLHGGDHVAQGEYEPDVLEAMDIDDVVTRGFILDGLDQDLSVNAITAEILVLTGPGSKRSTWKNRVEKVKTIWKLRRDWMYTEATWSQFRASDATIPLKKGTPLKEKRPPLPPKKKASSNDIEDAPVKPVDSVSMRKDPGTRKMQMQLNAAASMVATEMHRGKGEGGGGKGGSGGAA